MTDDEHNMANAALLLDEKIAERIRAAITTDPVLRKYIQGIIEHVVLCAMQQMANRLIPSTYYTTVSAPFQYPPTTYGNNTGDVAAGTVKGFW